MILLAATLALLAAVVTLHRADAGEGSPWLRRWAVGAIALIPAVYAAALLWTASDRIGQLRFDYVGKRLAIGPGMPLTAGGSADGSPDYEDLHDNLLAGLPPHAVELQPRSPTGFAIHVASPSPVVSLGVGGTARTLNSHRLAHGDRILLTSGTVARELAFDARWRSASLSLGGASFELRRGGAVTLDAVLHGLRVAPADGEAYRSAVFRSGGEWRIVLREAAVRVQPSQGGAKVFQPDHTVDDDSVTLALQVVWNGALRTLRRDTVVAKEDGRVEVRFGRPQRIALPPVRGSARWRLTVPGDVNAESLIEVDDHSPRLQGWWSVFDLDPKGIGTLTHLGNSQPVTFGTVFSLGEGDDRVLLRIDRETFPWYLVAELLLFGSFIAVFLGPQMSRDAAFAALVGSGALLLANRLLFAYRAAERPPTFGVDLLTEARVSLWLVMALVLALRTLGWLIAVAGNRAISASMLSWPGAGLLTTSLAILLAQPGPTVLLPIVLLSALVAAIALAGRASVATRLARLREQGAEWRWWYPALVGALVLGLRVVSRWAGMPETLRIGDLRLLLTVIQIPLSVVVVALSLHLVQELELSDGLSLFGALRGVVAVKLFLGCAFVAVAVVAKDSGLFVAQALPYEIGLLALLPPLLRRAGVANLRVRDVFIRGLAALLIVLPALGVLWMNRRPDDLIRLVSWVRTAPLLRPGQQGIPGPAVVADAAGGQGFADSRLLRLYMLSNPGGLTEAGLVASERMATHFSTLEDYGRTGGWWGRGYLATELPRYLGDTHLSDLVPMAFLLPEQGKLGLAGLALLYVVPVLAFALFASARRGARGASSALGGQGIWLTAVALLAVAAPSLFMILGNLNLALFTGKNCALLGVNSLSDAVESGALLGLAALGLALHAGRPARAGNGGGPR